MEYCDGHELTELMNQKRSEDEAANIVFKILQGLNHIHSINVAHRDLKPENIMINSSGEPKIIDFGLSKDTMGNTRVLKSLVGSRLYMAPEIL
jgi:5'-AMP-activated protein kinase catalytic alpha subunit